MIALLGGVTGALVAGVALLADERLGWHLTGVSTASVRTMFGAFLGSAITATAVLFWVRGTLVQLAASELSARLLKGYLNDWFLNLAFAFLLAVFSHALVTLLFLPDQDAEPVRALTALTGAVLAFMALVLIVHAVHNSVHALDPSRVILSVTAATMDAIVRVHPRAQDPSADGAAPDSSGGGAGRPLGEVRTQRWGWVTAIDYRAVADALPAGGVARLTVGIGDLVMGGGRLAEVSARGSEEAWDAAAVEAAFGFSDARHLQDDVEYGLAHLVGLALQSLTPGSADRATAYEALRCINVLLNELLRRQPQPLALAFDDDRVVVRWRGRTNRDIVHGTLGELRQGAEASAEFATALNEDLRGLASQLRRDGFDGSADLVEGESASLVADRHYHGDDAGLQGRQRVRAGG